MTVKFKSGPNQSHFSNLLPGDVFIIAEQAGDPPERRMVFIKTGGYEGARANAVRLSDGDVCIVPAKSPVIKVEAVLSVSM